MYKFILLIALLTLTSCGGNHSETPQKMGLNYVREIMNDNPGLALEHLKVMSQDSIEEASDKALYGVLYSQALDKEFIYIKSDSIIAPSLEYYKAHPEGNEELLMMAYFYKGRVEFHQENLVESLTYMLKAEELAGKMGKDFYLGLIYRNIAWVYGSVYNYVAAIGYHEKALEAFRHTGKEMYIQYAYYDLAIDLHNHSERDKALDILKEVEKYAKDAGDTYLLGGIYGLCANIYVGKGDNVKANEYYDKYFATALDEDITTMDRWNAVNSYYKAGRKEDAGRLYTSFAEVDSGLQYLPYSIYASEGDYQKAYIALKEEHERVCGMMLDVFDQGVSRAMADHKDAKAAELSSSLRHERMMKGALGVMAAVIAVVGAIAIRHMLKIKARKMENLRAHISELGQSLAGANMRLEQTYEELRKVKEETTRMLEKERGEIIQLQEQKRLAALHSNMSRLSVINSLLKELASMRHSDDESRTTAVMERLDKEVRSLGSDKKVIRALEAEMDFATGGLMATFKRDFPGAKEKDCLMLMYLFYGFNVSSISVILSVGSNVVSSRRRRLIEKVNESDSARKADLLSLLQ